MELEVRFQYLGGVHHPFSTMCGGRLKLRAFGGRWTKQAPSSFPDPGFSRPGSAWLRSPALVCKGREAPWALDLSNDLAPHFLPRPGGGSRKTNLAGGAWPGRGQCGQEACGRAPHPVSSLLAPLPGRLWAEGGPSLPSLPSPAPPRPAFQRWGHGGFLCVCYFFICLECM